MKVTKQQFDAIARAAGKPASKGKVRKTPRIDYAWLREMHHLSNVNASWFSLNGPHFPIRINRHEHHMVTAKRNRMHREMGFWLGLNKNQWGEGEKTIVTFIRYSCQTADSDNLPSAYKALRDGIADAFGVNDAPGGPIEWKYEQVKTKRGQNGLRVNFQRKL